LPRFNANTDLGDLQSTLMLFYWVSLHKLDAYCAAVTLVSLR